MPVYALDDLIPEIDPTAWIAPDAHVIGRVRLGPGASVWYGCTLRGDNEWITIGAGSNVQEGTIMHTDVGFPLTVGERVTIGHRATLHGCTVGDGSLVGIGATVLNGAVIGRDSLVGAGALVTEGKAFPDGVLIMGAPAKVARELTPEQSVRVRSGATHYIANAQRHAQGLRRLDAAQAAANGEGEA
jgi:carbonic anhydrase/acetyltransferase-like protein (isoleucine patch superfamily)